MQEDKDKLTDDEAILLFLGAVVVLTPFLTQVQVFIEENFVIPQLSDIVWKVMLVFAGGVALVMIGLTIVFFYKYGQVLKKESEAFMKRRVVEKEEESYQRLQKRWKNVLSLSTSETKSDWRVAILEADILLDDALSLFEVEGETLGERLKKVERIDLPSIDRAWRAHKFRNKLAHSRDFLFDQDEVLQHISDYQTVFRDIGIL